MVFLWFSYGFPMVFLWFSYGFPMKMDDLVFRGPQLRRSIAVRSYRSASAPPDGFVCQKHLDSAPTKVKIQAYGRYS